MAALEIITAAGIGLQAVGSILDANSKANQADQQALLDNLQADEIQRRAKIEDQNLRAQGKKVINAQKGTYAASGVDVSSGSPLVVMEQTQSQIDRMSLEQQREAKFQADQLRQGAQNLRSQANTTRIGGWLGVGGSLLSNAHNFPTIMNLFGSSGIDKIGAKSGA